MTKKIQYILILFVIGIMTVSAKGRRVLFIGDSITDGAWGNSKVWNTPSEERNHNDMNHIYGHGYMMICASHYQATMPEEGYQFWNRGISGNTLQDLYERWEKDALSLNPDVISILIGTNDADRFVRKGTGDFDIKAWELKYRNLLDKTRKSLPEVKFVLCTPFVAYTGKMTTTTNYQQRLDIIHDMDRVLKVIAKDYDAVLVPFDTLFDQLASKPAPTETYWIWDGIHPTPAAHYLMAQMWISTFSARYKD